LATLRIAVPDMVSNTFLPVLAAVDLGCFRDEGVDASVTLIPPQSKAFAALRDGEVDFVAGAAHAVLSAFPAWQGAKLLAAVRQHLPWVLVVRKELGAAPPDLNILKGLRIGAAPGPDAALQHLLRAAAIEPDRDGVQIVWMSEAAESSDVSFGVAAAHALVEGRLDGFWANGLAAAVAIDRGVGSVLLDPRRDDGPPDARDYTFAALVTTDRILAERTDVATAAVRALVSAQRALQEDPRRATEVGQRRFPPFEAGLISDVVRLDAPYYEAEISVDTIATLNRFARDIGRLDRTVPYEDVVATQMRPLWRRGAAPA
jgi:ABC-type nitrate/sulfonate/bicarbonate transport system substrate-binding protein